MTRVRPPLDGLCPECRELVEEAVVTDSRSGPCVVLWPCRHQFPLNDRTDVLPSDVVDAEHEGGGGA